MKDFVFKKYQEDFLINSNSCCSTLYETVSLEMEDEKVLVKSEDIKTEIHDNPLEEVNLGDDENSCANISKLLIDYEKQEIIEILKEFKNYFCMGTS